MRVLSVTMMAACAASCASPSHAREAWRGYSFGMTRDEARAVPGISWQADSEVIPNFIVVSSAAPVRLNGKLYDVNLTFTPASHLHQISFVHKIPDTPADKCKSEFEAQLAELDGTYGSFSPRKPERDEKTLEIKQVLGTGTSYATLIQDVSGTVAAEMAGDFVKLSAYRDTGSYTVFVNTVWTTKGLKCTSIRYRLLEN